MHSKNIHYQEKTVSTRHQKSVASSSDWHYSPGKKNKKDFRAIADSMIAQKPDAILLGGDIAKDEKSLRIVLNFFKNYSGVKLAYLGNWDWKFTKESTYSSTLQYFSNIFNRYGFRLLDEKPFSFENSELAIVGNSGFYDPKLSLLDRKTEINSELLSQFISHNIYHYRVHPDFIYKESLKKLIEHLGDPFHQSKEIILGIHHVPSREFLIDDSSNIRYVHTNGFMGSDLYPNFYLSPNVIDGLTGLSQRSTSIYIGQVEVQNISSAEIDFWVRKY